MSLGRRWGEPIPIVGMGVITPYGQGVETFANALRDGRSAIESVQLSPFGEPRPAGLLPAQSVAEWISPITDTDPELGKRLKKLLRRTPVAAALSALVAIEAWKNAGLAEEDSSSMGIVVGGHSLGSSYEFGLREKFDASPHHLPPSFAVHLMDTDHVGILSDLFQIHGPGFTVGGASASGQMAIIQAANLIRLGDVDRCLVVGPLADLNPMALQSFESMGALGGHDYSQKPHEASRPFDDERNGFIFSQACGAIILESNASCSSSGRSSIGSLSGSGIYLDGTALPSPSANGEAAGMKLAMEAAGVGTAEIDTINAHGTASNAGDIAELEAIASVFGAHATSLKVQSTKGLLGHTLWAAGLVETIAVLIQMRDGFTHQNANLTTPIRTDVAFAPSKATEPGPEVALCNSFGFGGINTSILVTKEGERNPQ